MKKARLLAVLLAVMFTFTFVLTACVKPTTVDLKYAGGDGATGSVATQSADLDESGKATFTLSANGFIKTGYTFVGWELPDSTVESAGATIEITETTTVTAKWEVTPENQKTISLTYAKGNGSAVGETSIQSNTIPVSQQSSTFVLNACGYVTAGFYFAGWVLADGTVKQPGNTVTLSDSASVTAKWTKNDNNSTPFVLATATLDGIFSPFFYTGATDSDVVGLIFNSLLTTGAQGEIVAGDDYDTIAKSYSVSTPNSAGEVTYEFVIKNGLKFSDGTAVTADDVLFNYYVYLDPAYVGSSTLYNLPIKGLKEYRAQNANIVSQSEAYLAIRDAIAADVVYDANNTAGYTELQYNAFWNELNETGVTMANDIYAYMMKYYNATYLNAYFGLTVDEANELGSVIKWGLAMRGWGFGTFEYELVDSGNVDDDGDPIMIREFDFTKFNAANGVQYAASELNAGTYWQVIKDYYTDDNGISSEIDAEEAAGNLPYTAATAALLLSFGDVPVTSIAGLSKGTTVIDGVTYETVLVVCTEQHPKTILSLGVTVAPKAYYTKGYTYRTGSIVNYGCELGLKEIDGVQKKVSDFINHLKTFNSAPVGSGAYKMSKGPGGSFFENDSIVYFERNDQFESFGLGTAIIKYVRMKVIGDGKEFDALKAGEVDYAEPSADSATMNEISGLYNLTAVIIDNLGYGYICINPTIYSNINERIALNTVLYLDAVYDYYPEGLVDVIYRSMSTVSWAYPEGAEAIYDYDATGAVALEYFLKAGYTQVGGKLLNPDGEQANFKFTLPYATNDHPAGGIFLKARDILVSIGATVEIIVDGNLTSTVKNVTVAIYALAWQASLDPDMYQVNHYLSQAESVVSNGIAWLYANGGSSDLGTIVWKGQTLTQKEALVKLGELIEEALEYMEPADRAPIYAEALELLATLAIEIPTYQRKNLVAYNSDLLDALSLNQEVTAYRGPLAEIWKVSLV